MDAITGGTITSDGVSDMLYKTLDVYNSYFASLREENQTIDTLIRDTIMSINNNKLCNANNQKHSMQYFTHLKFSSVGGRCRSYK